MEFISFGFLMGLFIATLACEFSAQSDYHGQDRDEGLGETANLKLTNSERAGARPSRGSYLHCRLFWIHPRGGGHLQRTWLDK